MKIEKLKPLEKNPFKSKGDKQIEKIGKSIKDFERMMSIRKIIIDENNEILGGNKRYFALKKLGYTDISDDWIEKVTDLTEEEKKEFIVKDNAHWGSEWDFDMLNDWGVDLAEFGVDVGFDLEESSFNEEFDLPDGDKPPFQQMTFTLSDEQAELINLRISEVKKQQEYKSYCDNSVNENSNGNAISYIVSKWVEQKK
jgi:ParB-like chromosome segregation protein Spo0J